MSGNCCSWTRDLPASRTWPARIPARTCQSRRQPSGPLRAFPLRRMLCRRPLACAHSRCPVLAPVAAAPDNRGVYARGVRLFSEHTNGWRWLSRPSAPGCANCPAVRALPHPASGLYCGEDMEPLTLNREEPLSCSCQDPFCAGDRERLCISINGKKDAFYLGLIH